MVKRKFKWFHIALLVGAVLILIFSFIWCKMAIRRELQAQIQENLKDVASQNVLAFEADIRDKQNLLVSMAEEITGVIEDGHGQVISMLEPLTDTYQFKRTGFIDENGIAYTTDGYKRDLSFREFLKQAMQGNFYIAGPVDDTLGDKEEKITVFSVPVYGKKNGEIKGALFATYQTKKFQEVINIDSFGGEGYNYIVEKDGTVIAGSPHSTLRIKSNILTYVKELTAKNQKNANKLLEEMENGKTGSIVLKLDDNNYVYYMPIHYSFNSESCYMLTIVPTQILMDRISPVLRYVNILLLTIAVVILVTAFAYIYTYQKGRLKLLQLAYTDSLTNGDNYACFELKLEEKKGVPGYLISMDFSEFKIVNNTCGAEKGDEAILNVWLILRKAIRLDELAARISADNFILFLEEEHQGALTERLCRITDMITKLSVELNIPRLSPYFGIYAMKWSEPLEVAYSCANEAKHLVKGRHDTNYAFYDEVDFQQMMERKELEDRFESALENREFEVWYQPKYSADKAEIVGAEALIRWRKPDGTLIPPFKFIPLFEQNGLISELDEYVFRAVCEQQKEWERAGKGLLPISVNISRASLYYSNVVEKYKNILAEYEVEAKYVPLEITESATIDNMEIRGLIDEFHAAGFPLLLDDFGNGYSSLATLNVMHFDILKLDKSLVDHIGDENGEKLLYYTIKLAKSLGMKITAEGVEYQEQVIFLQNLKCNDIQGFFFSKPLPLDEYQRQVGM